MINTERIAVETAVNLIVEAAVQTSGARSDAQ